MPNWNAGQYLQFEAQRTQPAIDLCRRAASFLASTPQKILDVGSGPGNSTNVLANNFPTADISGIDSSAEMVTAAQKEYPGLRFIQYDITTEIGKLDNDYDLVFSNACIQWIPNHQQLIPDLLGLLQPGGVLAVQVPLSSSQPVHQAVFQLTISPRWKQYFETAQYSNNLTPGQYFDLLSEHAKSFHIWEIAYYHNMPSHNAIIDWYKGAGLRPFLEQLPESERPVFEAEVLSLIEKNFPVQKNGHIIFRFPRLFFLASV